MSYRMGYIVIFNLQGISNAFQLFSPIKHTSKFDTPGFKEIYNNGPNYNNVVINIVFLGQFNTNWNAFNCTTTTFDYS